MSYHFQLPCQRITLFDAAIQAGVAEDPLLDKHRSKMLDFPRRLMRVCPVAPVDQPVRSLGFCALGPQRVRRLPPFTWASTTTTTSTTHFLNPPFVELVAVLFVLVVDLHPGKLWPGVVSKGKNMFQLDAERQRHRLLRHLAVPERRRRAVPGRRGFKVRIRRRAP